MSAAGRSRLEMMRDEMVVRDRIEALLRDGPRTVAEIAGALDCPVHEAMCWVMAMRRYGRIEEEGRPDDKGYFRYVLAEADGETGTGKE